MLLRSPTNLHYPITITELLKRPKENVSKFGPIFSYFYKSTVTEGDNLGNEYEVEKTFPSNFASSVDGELTAWKITKGTVINRAG